MPVSLSHIRDALMPGLLDLHAVPLSPQWAALFDPAPSVVESVLPMVSMPLLLAGAAAAVVIRNPVVSRRFWERS